MNYTDMKKILFIAAAFLMLGSSMTLSASTPQVWKGKKFADFVVMEGNPDKTKVRLSDYVGKDKYVIVDFWASWCGPCKREIPNLKSVYEKYAGDDFTVVSVAVWDKRADSEEIIKSYQMTWPQILDAGQTPTALYGIQGIPHIMLIGPDGIILEWDLRGDGIEQAVSKYVKAKK